MKKKDIIIISIILLVYSIISFWQLGSLKNPNTFTQESEINYQLENSQEISKILFFTGHEVNDIQIYTAREGEEYQTLTIPSDIRVFNWYELQINQEIDALKINLTETSLGEIALINKNGEKVSLISDMGEGELLQDEQDTIPEKISYYNTAYFDEIYFARTAYEYANGLTAYEWSHPPLGKLLMAIPVKLFGMTPFNYRFMGNVAGILMVLVMYLFANKIFKSTKYSTLAALMMAFDNFHFAQTRIGTTDSFLVLFILLSHYFMYSYLILGKEDSNKKKYLMLLFSGISIGCAIATKWTGLFAGLGLAIIFGIHFIYHYIMKKSDLRSQKSKSGARQYNTQNAIKIIGVCIGSFIAIPVLIYVLSYLLFPDIAYFPTKNLSELIETTKQMYQYHANLDAPHPFYSSWYTWPIMLKPVWYHVNYFLEGRSTIVGIGNPVIWWLGTISFIFLIIQAIRKRDKNAAILITACLCILVPYIGVDRGMFLYHYFPILPFIMLANVNLLRELNGKVKRNVIYIIYIILMITFFLYFFPVVSGLAMTNEYIDGLKWFSTWYF